jgi:hypothetical protein
LEVIELPRAIQPFFSIIHHTGVSSINALSTFDFSMNSTPDQSPYTADMAVETSFLTLHGASRAAPLSWSSVAVP